MQTNASFKPYPYQIKALNQLYKDLKVEKNVLFWAIMGAGKTAMASFLIKRLLKEQDMRVLILANKIKLIGQFYEELQSVGLDKDCIGICCQGEGGEYDISKRITIASTQSILPRIKKYGRCGLMVIDEVHNVNNNPKSQYAQIIKNVRGTSPNSRLLGLTATPYNQNGYIFGNKHVSGAKVLFKKPSARLTYAELAKSERLCPFKGVVLCKDSLKNDLANVTVNAGTGDFNKDELSEVLVKDVHIGTAVQAVQDHCPDNYKCVAVMAQSIKHAKKLQEAFDQVYPDQVAIVHSQQTGKARKENLGAWVRGEKRFIISVLILAEGFNHKPLSCVVMTAPTKSARIYVQICGRPLRVLEGKKEALLIDLTPNTEDFGTDFDDIRIRYKGDSGVTLKPSPKQKKCPECKALLIKTTVKCEKCGHIFSSKSIMKEILNMPEFRKVYFFHAETVNAEKQSAFREKDLRTNQDKVGWQRVSGLIASIHTKSSDGMPDKKMGKITLSYAHSTNFISQYIMMPDSYGDFPVKRSKFSWKKYSDFPFPSNADEFMDSSYTLKQPNYALIDNSREFPEILDLQFPRRQGKNIAERKKEFEEKRERELSPGNKTNSEGCVDYYKDGVDLSKDKVIKADISKGVNIDALFKQLNIDVKARPKPDCPKGEGQFIDPKTYPNEIKDTFDLPF